MPQLLHVVVAFLTRFVSPITICKNQNVTLRNLTPCPHIPSRVNVVRASPDFDGIPISVILEANEVNDFHAATIVML
jgi:hypothetical protein